MINLKFYTPKGEILKAENVRSITIPTEAGVISVFDDHQPLISLLGIGEIEVMYEDGRSEYIFITSGIVKVQKDSVVTIMADTSEFAEEINIDAAMEAKAKAEEYLKKKDDISDVEFAKLQGDIEREVARIEIAKVRRRNTSDIKVKVTRKD